MNSRKEIFEKNYDNFRFEINRLIRAYDLNFTWTHIDVLTCVYMQNIYYFFIIEDCAKFGERKVEFTDLYPFDFVFGDKSECIIYECVCDQLSNLNTIRIAEFTGREFDIIKNHYYLEGLKRVLSKLTFSWRFNIKRLNPKELSELETEILIIKQLISDEYERNLLDCYVSI